MCNVMGVEIRSAPVPSLPLCGRGHLYILSDIVGLSTFEEASVMPCCKHGENSETCYLD